MDIHAHVVCGRYCTLQAHKSTRLKRKLHSCKVVFLKQTHSRTCRRQHCQQCKTVKHTQGHQRWGGAYQQGLGHQWWWRQTRCGVRRCTPSHPESESGASGRIAQRSGEEDTSCSLRPLAAEIQHRCWRSNASLLALPTSSISQRWTLSTHLCFRTSLTIPPSPPPTTSTWMDAIEALFKAHHALCSHEISATLPSLDQGGRTEGYGWGTRDRQTHLSRCTGWLHPTQGRCQMFCCGGKRCQQHVRQNKPNTLSLQQMPVYSPAVKMSSDTNHMYAYTRAGVMMWCVTTLFYLHPFPITCLLNTRMLWYLDCSWHRTSCTSSDMDWPGHNELSSENQPWPSAFICRKMTLADVF